MDKEIEDLKQRIVQLTKRNEELEEKLKKYTNSTRHIDYYEKHKEEVKERTKNYVQKLKNDNPEKLKEWRRTYYLKRKERLQQSTTNSEP
jgi:predicted  nucleic acid-binding Zn-ribbon protein